MPSTYTTNLRMENPAIGEQSGSWGTTLNTGRDLTDQAVSGIVTVTLAAAGTSGSPNDLPITDGTLSNGRNKYITFTDGGDLGADVFVQLTPNTAKKVCYIKNNLSGSQDLYLFQGTYNASRDYVLAAGDTAVLAFSGDGASSSTVTLVEVDRDWTVDQGSVNINENNSANGVLALTSAEVTQLANIDSVTISGTNWTAVGNLSGTNTGDQTITLTGDVTGSGTGSFATTIATDAVETAMIGDDQVTYAKIQDVSATDRLLGRDTAAAGIVEELTVSGGVEFTGSGGIQRSALTGDVTASAGSNTTTIATDAVETAMIADNQVTLAKLEDGTQGDILYYGASGAPARLGAGTNGYYLKTQGAGANPVWAEVTTGTTSNSFETHTVTDTDSGYSWSATGSVVATSATDTLTWVSGAAIDIDADAASDAIRVDVADNGVTLAKMEHGTQGDILYYGGTGTPTRLGAGTSGQFLKTQGAGANPVWADATTDVALDSTPDADVSVSGITAVFTNGDSGSDSFGDIQYIAGGGGARKADADAAGKTPAIALATETVSASSTGTYLLQGFARKDAWNWTVGGLLYVSTTAGEMTQTAPSTGGDVVQIVGVAISADVVYFKPDLYSTTV